ncbi:MAG TPA: hypothetical protein PLP99_10970 [Ignavibacteriales bacterium]|nr:hypothetical protein [Ignavibacteriales bacterium]HOL82261.1 hypothetical protein [Ignavibacteriales bacterium]HPP34481.1 hypothetical protein [Ignavibacteriales bacterium]HRR19640.1 hypothetical protein [Ignavibacteriales bacterium]HRT98715.1 hypothetical protein [Ignavibacteriales bacterium]
MSFSDNGYIDKTKNMDNSIKSFGNYILKALNIKDKTSLWKVPRLKELGIMLKICNYNENLNI